MAYFIGRFGLNKQSTKLCPTPVRWRTGASPLSFFENRDRKPSTVPGGRLLLSNGKTGNTPKTASLSKIAAKNILTQLFEIQHIIKYSSKLFVIPHNSLIFAVY
jgi:hypothetical protein